MPNSFPNNYTRRPKAVMTEQDSENIITEQTGYLTTKQLVENMVLAGKRLYDYRHGLLDVEDVDSDDYDEEQDAASPYEHDMVDEAIDIQSKMERKASKKPAEVVSTPETEVSGGGSGEPEVRSEGETSPSQNS